MGLLNETPVMIFQDDYKINETFLTETPHIYCIVKTALYKIAVAYLVQVIKKKTKDPKEEAKTSLKMI